jgi:hypothetical protein
MWLYEYPAYMLKSAIKKMGKVHITSSNYHSIVNVPLKLPIVSMFPLKLPKNVNVPPNTNKKTKMTLIFF